MKRELDTQERVRDGTGAEAFGKADNDQDNQSRS